MILASCGREAPAGKPTLAILRFDNLSGDGSLDWMSRGMAEALSIELSHSQRYQVLPVSATVPSQATAVAYGRFSARGKALRADVAIQDLRSNERAITASAGSNSMLAAVHEVAGKIDPTPRKVVMPPEAALRFYSEALEAGDPQTAVASLNKAIEADPAFGRAYLAVIQYAKALGARDALERYLAASAVRAKDMDPAVRAALAHEGAVLRNDREGQIRALSDLARAQPDEAGGWQTLAQTEQAAGKYQDAALHFGRAAELDPSDAISLNGMGYALAFAGHFDDAIKALRRYEQVRPAEGNPLDSMGDVHYYYRRFADAARFYEDAQKREAGFLNGGSEMKAALAWHAAGDRSRADQAFQSFRDRRKATPEWPLWEAQWLATTGKPDAAIELLAAAGPMGRAHLLVLALETGNRELAQRTAAAGAPPALALLVDPNWEARLAQVAEPARSNLSGLALMFSARYEAAARAFDRARQATHGSDRAGYALMQAWCIRRSGAKPDPALTRFAPPPQVHAPNPLAALYFSRTAQ